jgi:putative transposase
MSSKYKIRDQEKPYFVTFTVVYWLDVFIRNEYREVLLDSLRYCRKMQDILRYFKSFTSRSLKEAIKTNAQESRKEWLISP